jgi:nucleotide-binding universal stress UspA family protein
MRGQTPEMKREHSRPATWGHQPTVSTSKSAWAMRHLASPNVAQTEADLVLAGTHGRTGQFRVLLGSVALALIDDVPGDVMIVPSKGARSPVEG